MMFLLALLGFILGVMIGGVPTGLVVAVAVAGWVMIREARKQIAAQGEQVKALANELAALRMSMDQQVPRGTVESTGEARGDQAPSGSLVPPMPPREASRPPAQEFARASSAAGAPLAEGIAQPAPSTRPPSAPVVKDMGGFEQGLEAALKHVREFLAGGNTVVRVGILVLLVGVVLLLKYAAERALFPIELRMASAALIGIALVGFGFRQREARPGFSMTLQGGGIATIYLVVFFSMRMYALMPAALAFALLAGLAICSGVMAVAQNSMGLIVIGIVGGFLAPVLASTGAGNHVVLFSYYTLLNLLILGVAWFKSWRPLNLLGFFFTFGIGTIWGALDYAPEHFASTEPFLIGFFLMYVSIVAIFAWRRPAQLKGWVDGSLTFGTPLVVLGLQYQLVKDIPFGMAYTALGMATVYVVTASFLYRRAPTAMRNLVEAFLALGIGFATLAIPYGFSNESLTGATWAVEGFGLFWLGIRQQRLLSRLAGLALQFMAGVALIISLLSNGYPSGAQPVLNAPFAACTLLVLSGLGVAFLGFRHRSKLHKPERFVSLLIPWAVVWWYVSAIHEVTEHLSNQFHAAGLVALVAMTGLALEVACRKLNWLGGRVPALLSVPGIFVLLLLYRARVAPLNPSVGELRASPGVELLLRDNPLGHGGWIAWPLLFGALCFTLLRLTREHEKLVRPFHAGALWGFGLFAALVAANFTRAVDGLGASWSVAALGAGWMIAIVVVERLRARIASEELRNFYRLVASGGLVLVLGLWHLRTSSMASGNSSPLPFLPLLNPIDLSLGLAFLFCLLWMRQAGRGYHSVLGVMAFVWFNGILARTNHHLNSVRYDLQSLWNSVSVQVSLSVSWTLIGLVTILWATRARNRIVWFVGGGLLAVVVAKLFLVDLKHLSSVAKIATFLVVGLLLLVVGYFSPVPPPVPPPATKSEETPGSDVEPS